MPPVIRVALVTSQPLIETVIRSLVATTPDLTLIDDTSKPLRPTSPDGGVRYDVMLLDAPDGDISSHLWRFQHHFRQLRFILLLEEQSDLGYTHLLADDVAGCVIKS